ncbi:hypothetical protein HQ590_00470 [bacterium]|nr:hypothetical protein [bacterium]
MDYPSIRLRQIARIAWFPVLIVIVHLILSEGFDAYRPYPVLNMLVHFLGGMAIVCFFDGGLCLLESTARVPPLTSVIRYTLIFSLTATAAVFWEFAEWLFDHFLGTQAQLSLDDTLRDMALGVAGGTLVVLLFLVRRRPTGRLEVVS